MEDVRAFMQVDLLLLQNLLIFFKESSFYYFKIKKIII